MLRIARGAAGRHVQRVRSLVASTDPPRNVTTGTKRFARWYAEIGGVRDIRGGDTFRDRAELFAGGEYDVGPLRLFGGGTATRTNLDPAASDEAGDTLPQTTVERAFGGVRLPVASHSYATLRYEGGGRRAAAVGSGQRSASDMGVATAEWRTSLRTWSLFGRYQWRDNVERVSEFGSCTQQEAWLQASFSPTRATQVFGTTMWTSRRAKTRAFSDTAARTFARTTKPVRAGRTAVLKCPSAR